MPRVASFLSAPAAQVAAGLLRDHGIDVHVEGDTVRSMVEVVGEPLFLVVPSHQVDAARALLDEPADEAPAQPQLERVRGAVVAVAGVLLVVLLLTVLLGG